MKPLIPLLMLLASSLAALTLDEATERAMTHSPQLQIAEGQVQVAKSGEKEAWAAFHPTLEAGYNWQYTENTTAFTFSPTHRYNLSANYNLFKGFTDSATVDAKKADTQASRYALEAVKADLKLAVVDAYSACLKAEKIVQTQKEELSSLTRQYEDTNARFEQGMVAKNDLLLIDVDRLRAEQALFKAESDIAQTRSRLRQLLGGAFDDAETLEDLHAEVEEPLPFDAMLEQTYANRSELKALKQNRESVMYQRKAVAGNYLPHVDLQGDYTVNDQARYLNTSLIQPKEQFVGMVNVSWTLYAGMANVARRKALLEQAGIEAKRLEQLKFDLRYQLRSAYEAFRVAKSARDVARRAVESAKENYRITADRHQYGQVDTLTLLVAQSNLTDATNGYNNAYYDLFVAYKTLERISGK